MRCYNCEHYKVHNKPFIFAECRYGNSAHFKDCTYKHNSEECQHFSKITLKSVDKR